LFRFIASSVQHNFLPQKNEARNYKNIFVDQYARSCCQLCFTDQSSRSSKRGWIWDLQRCEWCSCDRLILGWWVIFLSAPSARLFRYPNCTFTRISNGSSLSRNSWGSLVIFRRLLRGVAIAPRIFIGPLLSPPVTRSRIPRGGVRSNPNARGRGRAILADCGTYQRQDRHRGQKKSKRFHGSLRLATTIPISVRRTKTTRCAARNENMPVYAHCPSVLWAIHDRKRIISRQFLSDRNIILFNSRGFSRLITRRV